VTSFVTDPTDPRSGVLTYAFTRPRASETDAPPGSFGGVEEMGGVKEGEGVLLGFIELFEDEDAAAGHVASANEGESFARMFEDPLVGARWRCATLNPGGHPDDLGRGGAVLPVVRAGKLFDPALIANKWIDKYGDRMRPDSHKLVALEMWLEPLSTDEGQVKLMAALDKALTKLGTQVSAVVLTNEWSKATWGSPVDPDGVAPATPPPPAQPFSSDALIFHVILQVNDTITNHCLSRSTLSAVKEATKRAAVTYTAQDWSNSMHAEVVEHLNECGLPVVEERELLAGFLLHPMYCAGWTGKRGAGQSAEAGQPSAEPAEPAAAAAAAAAPREAPSCHHFSVRRHPVTGAPQAIVFDKAVSEAVPSTKASGYATATVLNVANRLCNVGRADREIVAGTVFAQLGRLRRLVHDVQAYNAASEEDLENDTELAALAYHLLQQFAIFYADVPTNRRVPLALDGVEELIATLEHEYRDQVDGARAALAEGRDATVEYMSLQDVYPIGSLVTTHAVGGLGPGVDVVLRVGDAFYHPFRSLFGGRKYSFKLHLECIVPIGSDFLTSGFTFTIEEWRGSRALRDLEFQPLPNNDLTRLSPAVRARQGVVASMMSRPTYVEYKGEHFFAHNKTGGGGASASTVRAGDGLAIIDTDLGMRLGHRPASGGDDFGAAIAGSLQTLRSAAGGARGDESEGQRLTRLREKGLYVHRRLSNEAAVTLWPTVVAFSFTLKAWGHLVVDAVRLAPASGAPWRELVLADHMKEVLRSTACGALRSSAVASVASEASVDHADPDVAAAARLLSRPSRYPRAQRTLIAGKGSGALFLLYGPPGSGKTLTVEALALLFGRPLYAVSFAELGTTVAELEERLTEVLALASSWGALVLLDEGDALVERRRQGELVLNSMSAVLLRLLERFDGALFMTSNRVAAFDPAALSRVTLAIRYRALDEAGLAAVWRAALVRTVGDDTAIDETFDCAHLAAIGGVHQSGRSVSAVLQLAASLADARDIPLNQQLLLDALDIVRSFAVEFEEDGAASGWD